MTVIRASKEMKVQSSELNSFNLVILLTLPVQHRNCEVLL